MIWRTPVRHAEPGCDVDVAAAELPHGAPLLGVELEARGAAGARRRVRVRGRVRQRPGSSGRRGLSPIWTSRAPPPRNARSVRRTRRTRSTWRVVRVGRGALERDHDDVRMQAVNDSEGATAPHATLRVRPRGAVHGRDVRDRTGDLVQRDEAVPARGGERRERRHPVHRVRVARRRPACASRCTSPKMHGDGSVSSSCARHDAVPGIGPQRQRIGDHVLRYRAELEAALDQSVQRALEPDLALGGREACRQRRADRPGRGAGGGRLGRSGHGSGSPRTAVTVETPNARTIATDPMASARRFRLQPPVPAPPRRNELERQGRSTR